MGQLKRRAQLVAAAVLAVMRRPSTGRCIAHGPHAGRVCPTCWAQSSRRGSIERRRP